VYVAFSGNKVEVEVFAPSPALARQAAASGRIKPIR
jgi:hypothetical protein